MRRSPLSFALIRTFEGQWAFGEGFDTGFRSFSKPPTEGDYFWAPDFFLDDPKPFLKPKRLLFLKTSDVRECLQALIQTPFSKPYLFDRIQWQKSTKESYRKSFENFKNLFQTSNLKKIVPVLVDEGHLTNEILSLTLYESLLFLFDQLSQLPPNLTPYFFVHKDEWMFGATPENLLCKNKDQLSTQAVAGTASDPSQNLLQDPKEMQEHLYVVEEIETILSRYGDVEKGNTYEKLIPGLKHLVTDLHLQFSEADFNTIIEVAQALHPTPALGGTPKDIAFQYLKSQPESENRRRYGAPFGYVSSSGQAHLVVAIRCLQLLKEKMLSIAGAGLIDQSDFEKEWREIQAKKNSVFKIFDEAPV